MKFTYTDKKIDLPKSVHAYAEKKVAKLERYFKQEMEANAVFSVQKGQNNVELTIRSGGTIIRVAESTADMFATIDACVASVERQLRKNKTRLEKRLREHAPAIHADFSGGREGLELGYSTVSNVSNPQAPPRELLPLLLEHQERHRKAEIDSRQCLSGPHKDDLSVKIGGQEAKTYASQGQTRTAALSLKLAQREIFQEETGEWPVLLLDDVLSELDPRRQAFVLNRIRGGQVFITCCEEEKLEGLEGGRAFHICGGKLV